MIIIKAIDEHEMARRYAIGEVYSQFFSSAEDKKDTLRLLTSGDRELERQGILRHWKTRGYFVDSLPKNTDWHLAKLSLSEDEFIMFRTVNLEGWVTYTNRSLRLIDAAVFLQTNPNRDQRVASIVSACEQGQFEMSGITLFGASLDSPFTIVEGTARLVALYLNCVQQVSSPLCIQEIEVALGLSQMIWTYS